MILKKFTLNSNYSSEYNAAKLKTSEQTKGSQNSTR